MHVYLSVCLAAVGESTRRTRSFSGRTHRAILLGPQQRHVAISPSIGRTRRADGEAGVRVSWGWGWGRPVAVVIATRYILPRPRPTDPARKLSDRAGTPVRATARTYVSMRTPNIYIRGPVA